MKGKKCPYCGYGEVIQEYLDFMTGYTQYYCDHCKRHFNSY